MTGLELIMKSLITEYFPNDKRSKGYNVWHRRDFEIRDRDNGKNIIFLYACIIKLVSSKNQTFSLNSTEVRSIHF